MNVQTQVFRPTVVALKVASTELDPRAITEDRRSVKALKRVCGSFVKRHALWLVPLNNSTHSGRRYAHSLGPGLGRQRAH